MWGHLFQAIRDSTETCHPREQVLQFVQPRKQKRKSTMTKPRLISHCNEFQFYNCTNYCDQIWTLEILPVLFGFSSWRQWFQFLRHMQNCVILSLWRQLERVLISKCATLFRLSIKSEVWTGKDFCALRCPFACNIPMLSTSSIVRSIFCDPAWQLLMRGLKCHLNASTRIFSI